MTAHLRFSLSGILLLHSAPVKNAVLPSGAVWLFHVKANNSESDRLQMPPKHIGITCNPTTKRVRNYMLKYGMMATMGDYGLAGYGT